MRVCSVLVLLTVVPNAKDFCVSVFIFFGGCFNIAENQIPIFIPLLYIIQLVFAITFGLFIKKESAKVSFCVNCLLLFYTLKSTAFSRKVI